MTLWSPKICRCCGAVIETRDAWRALRLVGTMINTDDDSTLELRDCPGDGCKNTLAWESVPPFAERDTVPAPAEA